jgi:hypothetical protein
MDILSRLQATAQAVASVVEDGSLLDLSEFSPHKHRSAAAATRGNTSLSAAGAAPSACGPAVVSERRARGHSARPHRAPASKQARAVGSGTCWFAEGCSRKLMRPAANSKPAPAASAAVVTSAQEAWRGFDARQAALRRAVDALKRQQAGGSGSRGGGGEHVAELLAAASDLAELPDPQHALDVAAASCARSADLEASVHRLERELGTARLDDAEVARLAAAHENERAEHATTRSELEAAQVCERKVRAWMRMGSRVTQSWRRRAATDELRHALCRKPQRSQSELAALRATAGSIAGSEVQLAAALEEAAHLKVPGGLRVLPGSRQRRSCQDSVLIQRLPSSLHRSQPSLLPLSASPGLLVQTARGPRGLPD